MKKLFLVALIACSTSAFADCTGLTVNLYMNPASCYGSCNGHGYVTASGGSGNYSYSFVSSTYSVLPNQVNDSVYNLCAGNYYVLVNDVTNGCLDTNAFNITSPPSLAVITNGNSTMCQGSFVNLVSTSTGGTPGYTWSWSPSTGLASSNSSSTTASPAVTTNYIITVTDANGCTATASSTITVNPLPVVTVNSPTICSGMTATLSASGATTYSWSAGVTMSGPNTGTVTPSVTTSYTVTGVSNGCTKTAVATVTVVPTPFVTASSNSTTCGACNGSAIATASPAGSIYSWSGPNGYSANGATIPSLCAGTYFVTAVYMGCVSTPASTNVVSSGSTISTSISNLTASSCNLCNGSATVNVTGGNGPYTYVWSNGITTPGSTNLCSGTYTVTVTDNSGCNTTTVVTIPSSVNITGTFNTTGAACGLCDGSTTLALSGGATPYTYNWSGTPNGQGTSSLSNLCTGTYSVIVTDANGCTFNGNTTVNNTNQVYATANFTAATCGMCDGSATALATGGVGSYMYSVNGSLPQSSNSFTGLCSGVYTIAATDVNGCVGNYVVTIPSANSSAITVSSNIQNESGNGLHNGSINLTVSGSTGPYSFIWSNGAVTEDIYSLSGGTYSVIVSDTAGNCGTYYFSVSIVNAYGWISGYAYNDNNFNCVYDGGDQPLSGLQFSVTDGVNTYSAYTISINGYYSIWVPNGNYTVTPTNTTSLEGACSSTYNVTVNGNNANGNNFAYNMPPFIDVCVSAFSMGVVPGFNGYYNLSCFNYGTQPASGILYIVLPGVASFVNASPGQSSVSGDTVFFNYSNIAPNAGFYSTVWFHTSASAVLGTTATAIIHATVTNGVDVNPLCNTYYYSRIINGSFDPNEKSVSPTGTGVGGDIPLSEREFTYLIQFQNTGTGPAVNIAVDDSLSSQLDPASIEILNVSHAYTLQTLPSNVLRWQFDNIMLPDSNSNEPASHGFIQFKARKLNSPMPGEVIENKAYIYFDFNAPVITNTAINTYNVAAGVEEQMISNGVVSVFPNPFHEQATFVISSGRSNETYYFVMKDVLGKTVRSIITDSKQFTLAREELNSGMYFYSIMSDTKVLANGKLIIK
jgi:hypothetical protein